MTTRTQVIIPTAINVVTFVNDAILAARRAGEPAALSLPTLRTRAKLIVNGTGSLHIKANNAPVNPSAFTR